MRFSQRRNLSTFELAARRLALNTLFPAVLKAVHRASDLAETRLRRSFAIQRHVQGSGLEIGAAATPAMIPVGASVRYVDKYGVDQLRADPELKGLNVRPPDIIASAEKLEGVEDDSQDFVVAFSLLEHVQDVLGSIASFYRVTRDGGSIVISVPDKRYYRPDSNRPLTEIPHFARDYRDGPEWSRVDHLREVGMLKHGLSGSALDDFVRDKIENDGHAHFHVWTAETFLAMLVEGKRVTGLDYEIVEFAAYEHEALAVLRVSKRGGADRGGAPDVH